MKRSGAIAAALVVVWLATFLLPSYGLFLATSACISALLALSVGVVSGRAGLISLCQLSFAGAGAWIVAWLHTYATYVPLPLDILLAGCAAVPIGLIVGAPAIRLRGVDLAIATLALATASDAFFSNGTFPGADAGASVTRPTLLANDLYYLWFVIVVLVGVAFALHRIDRAPLGAAWLQVRESERAASAIGIDVARTKLSAFAASAFVAGLGGGLLAAQLGVLSSHNFEPGASLALFVLGVMAGARFIEGALLAGALVVFVPEGLLRLGLPQDISSILFAFGAIQAMSSGSGIAETLRRQLYRQQHLAPSRDVQTTRLNASHGSESDVVLSVDDLTVRYGEVVAVDHISLDLRRDRVLALIGPNGAGKTTLVDAITGFAEAVGGSITIAAGPVDKLPAHLRARRGVRRTFQHDRMADDITVENYIRLAAGGRVSGSLLQAALDSVGYTGCDVPLGTLPGATRRAVEIAGALCARPNVLLLDEPAAGLIRAESERLARVIASIPARYGCAVVVIEHDLAVISACATDAIVLDHGRVIAAGSPSEVLASRIVTEAYLGEELAVGSRP